MDTTALRFEQDSICNVLYDIARGTQRFFAPSAPVHSDAPVPEKVTSKPQRPGVLEFEIPLFKFINYAGARVVLGRTDLKKIEQQFEYEGILAHWKNYLASKSPVIFMAKASGYLERRVSHEVVRAAEIAHGHAAITRNAPLPARVCNPAPKVFRVVSAELSEQHVSTLEAAVAEGTTVKFKGKPHLVRPTAGSWSTVTAKPLEYDLVRN